jgi:hypothetical protein
MPNRESRERRTTAPPVDVAESEKAESGPSRLYAPGKQRELESGPSRLRRVVIQQPVEVAGSLIQGESLQRTPLDTSETGSPRIVRYTK